MKFLGIVVGIIVAGAIGVMAYAMFVEAPAEEIEVVIPDDKLPG